MIRAVACARLLNISRSALYDWLDPKSPRYKKDFPKRIRLSSRVIGWRLSEVNAWISSKQTDQASGGAK
ncbi:AlpA family phage regulatory protein [Lampropedia puyangensis]|uniref:AlpA family phage regulatory protein n=1 Tax=Lampropedia puyangensis TaxID=1330072 RepID=A0A4S8ELI6_9BURK|nr:AlpA family phage regulatory protein [Lampropedia puyangensis]